MKTQIRTLPLTVTPLTCETLSGYIERLALRNKQSPGTLRRAITHSDNPTHTLARYTGREAHALRQALPELRPDDERDNDAWVRVILGHRSQRPVACSHCTAAAGAPPRVEVHAPRSRVLCRKHRRWIGGPYRRCDLAQQFSIREFPEVITAARRHHRSHRTFGVASTNDAFFAAIRAFDYWAHHGVLRNRAMTDIHRRLHALDVGIDVRFDDPLNHAACYPNTVKLTAIILHARYQLLQHGRDAQPEIITATVNEVALRVLSGIRPTGVGDPLHQALQRDNYDPDDPYCSWGDLSLANSTPPQ
ncbi:hypothetical protein AB0I30_23225 [Nocardia tengchongensis]|uniref:hypothetical protein n=1 Tax=Nocardia tengchongensis TaxID=2055889 RepID=UPI0033E35091